MAYPRYRNDSSPTVYHMTNGMVGEPGEILLNQRQRNRLSLIIRQAARLFCVKVISFDVRPSGYSLVCAAPAALPTCDELREHFYCRYGTRREMPDFDNPEVYGRWASRLRDFSCLGKDIQQRFTQWYNRVVRKGMRKGTLWKSRFESRILKTAKQTLATVKKTVGKALWKRRIRKVQGQRWRRTKQGCSFLRDTALSGLTVSANAAMLATYVLLDEMSRFPQAPFPIKILRDAMDEGLRKWERQ